MLFVKPAIFAIDLNWIKGLYFRLRQDDCACSIFVLV